MLVVVAGPRRGERRRLDRPVVLGRGTLAGLDLGDPMVSRSHAVVSPTARGWEVADLGSGNGTFLNGQALGAAMRLVDGDELRLGDTRVAFREEEPESKVAAREAPGPGGAGWEERAWKGAPSGGPATAAEGSVADDAPLAGRPTVGDASLAGRPTVGDAPLAGRPAVGDAPLAGRPGVGDAPAARRQTAATVTGGSRGAGRGAPAGRARASTGAVAGAMQPAEGAAPAQEGTQGKGAGWAERAWKDGAAGSPTAAPVGKGRPAAAPDPAFLLGTLSGSLAIPLASSPGVTGDDLPAEAEVRLLRRRLQLIGEVAEAMSRTTDVDELLGVILRRVMEALPQADRACVALLDEGSEALAVRVAVDRRGARARMPLSQKLLRSAVDSRQALLVADTRLGGDFSGRETVGRLGLRSLLCLPLVAGSQAFGALQVETAVEGRPFQPDDLHALAGVAPSIALAIANASLHGQLLAAEIEMRDLDLARRVQQQLMPQEPPAVPGYGVAFRCQPALAVGGDFFDFLPLPGGSWSVALGDVSGKGVSAALLMARVMSDLRFLAGQGLPPAEAVGRLSQLLAGATREAMFATLVYLELDPATGTLDLVNAGHPSPLLRRADGQVLPLDLPPGLPAGVRAETSYRSHRAHLAPGDTLLLYTDGLTEAVAASGERYGDDRLRQALAAIPAAADPESIVSTLLDDVATWSRGCPPADDLTLACIVRE